MKHFALFLAGGSSQRMDGIVHDKILAEIAKRPVIAYSLEKFYQSGIIDGAIVVYRDPQQRREIQAIVAQIFPKKFSIFYAQGGLDRSDSVRAGLDLLPAEAEYVYIHDCARPAVKQSALVQLKDCLLKTKGAVSLAKRATDTIKFFETDPSTKPQEAKTIDRNKLWIMETPQAFPKALIEKAHDSGAKATDDLALVEAIGGKVTLVENKSPNPKLTTPADFIFIEAILNSESPMINANDLRIGHGYDIHQLVPNRKLILGGVDIPCDVGLLGHSDADVLSHAIADAILGAVGLPDIGHHFPNTDATIAGINSQRILAKCIELATEKGFRLVNVDASLIAEKPKINPYLQAMKSNLARTLKIPADSIGIKATTNEKIGSLGQAQGIAAHAVVLMRS